MTENPHHLWWGGIQGVVISEDNKHVGTMFTPETQIDPFEGLEEIMMLFNVEQETDYVHTINSDQFTEYKAKEIG